MVSWDLTLARSWRLRAPITTAVFVLGAFRMGWLHQIFITKGHPGNDGSSNAVIVSGAQGVSRPMGQLQIRKTGTSTFKVTNEILVNRSYSLMRLTMVAQLRFRDPKRYP